jgi:hypothetical protein
VPQKLLVFKSFKIQLCFSYAMLLGCRRVQSKAYPARFLLLVSSNVPFSQWLVALSSKVVR